MIPNDIEHVASRTLTSQSSIYDSIYPRQYIAYRAPPISSSSYDRSKSATPSPAVTIDGNLDKSFWNHVRWSEDFVDNATDTKPKFRTRVKMRWDDDFLYIGKPIIVIRDHYAID